MNAQTKEGWYDPAATTFGDRLAGAREASGMTQSDLAKRLGVKIKTLKSWEDDLSEPRANKLSMIAGLVNVSLLWLLSGEGPGAEPPEDEVEISSEMKDLLTELRDIRAQVALSTDRLGRLEKALRAQIKEDILD